MFYKNFDLIKSDEDAGKISGYFSTYDRIPDSYGDVIAKGAFTETIQKRKESGHPFPLCFNHDLNQIIGALYPEDIEDTDQGPLMTASFFDTPLAQEKRALVKSGVVYQFSFMYDVLEAGPTTLENGTKANELKKLDLFEVSIVPVPANPRAEVTDVKAGRRNSGKDEGTIRDAISALETSIDALRSLIEADDPDNREDEAKANAAAEELEPSNLDKEQLLEYIKNMSMED